jgi:glucosylceramidase
LSFREHLAAHRRRLRRLGWVLAVTPVLIIVLTLPAAPAAPTGSTRTRRSATAANRLPTGERQAITIRSVTAVGGRSTGLVVTAAFRGDFARSLLRAPLRHAVLVLILSGASGTKATGGVLDEGGGEVSARVPLVIRHGNRATAVRSAAVNFSEPDRVVRMPPTRHVAVLRDGSQVIFSVPRSELRGITRMTVETFITNPIGSRALTDARWRTTLGTRAFSRSSLAVPPPLTCARVRLMIQRRIDVSPVDLEPELVRQKQLLARLKAVLRDYPSIARLVRRTPSLRGVTAMTLAREVAATNARIARLNSEIAGVGGTSARINALIRDCAAQSPASPPPSPTPTTPSPSPAPAVVVTQTDPALGQDLSPQPGLSFSGAATGAVPVIDVNDQVRYQRFTGLGAAMTDSAAWLIEDNLAPASRTQLVHDLFSPAGIGLTFLRVPMGASDFTVSTNPYTYDDMPAGQSDPTLAHFSIAHDLSYIIPAIRQALQANPALRISANPWSPPAWLKLNDALDNRNDAGGLLSTAYQPLAGYFVKFIQAYAADGVPIDDIVPQNEPATPPGGGTAYPGLTLPDFAEAAFIANNLQPALTAAGLTTKVYGNDLSWDQLSYAQYLTASSAGRDLAGIAWHCYVGSPAVMTQLHQADPNLDQIVDECSPEIRSFGAPEFLISVLRNWASEAAVWNVALDPQGGPKQTNNGCPGCIGLATVNEQTQSFAFTTEYYQLGQVSGFVQPGAVRIDSPNFVTYGTNSSNGFESVSSGLDDVAFLNPDGSKVLITDNNSSAPISFAVQYGGQSFSYTSPARAMTTFRWP